MYPIDTPSATADHKFTEGSPAGGVPATTVSAVWLNDLQEEVLNILRDRGVTPEKGNQGQLLEAINALIGTQIPTFTAVQQGGGPGQNTAKVNIGWSDISRLLASVGGTSLGAFVLDSDLALYLPKRTFAKNDYIRIPDTPGGLIIQWQEVNEATSEANITPMHIRFPNMYLGGSATLNEKSTGGLGQAANIVLRIIDNGTFQFTSGGTYGGGAVAFVLLWGF